MPLDFAIYDDAGLVNLVAPIGLRDHAEMLRYASGSARYPLIQRMTDYWEGAFYDADEVAQLMRELRQLEKEMTAKTEPPVDPAVWTTLKAMQAVCLLAIQEDCHVRANPD